MPQRTPEEKKAYMKAYRLRNKEKIAAARKVARQNRTPTQIEEDKAKAKKLASHPKSLEANRKRSAKYRDSRTIEQVEKDREYRVRYDKENKDRLKKRNKAYYETNKAEIEIKTKLYRELNKDEIKERRKAISDSRSPEQVLACSEARHTRHKQREAEDPSYKISRLFRSRVSRAIKEGYGTKSIKVIEMLGCDWDEARTWIESKWVEGMSWDNHSLHGWHIDHIIPVSNFNLADEEQQKICFNYKNLQPLWALDNLIKSNKI